MLWSNNKRQYTETDLIGAIDPDHDLNLINPDVKINAVHISHAIDGAAKVKIKIQADTNTTILRDMVTVKR